MPMRSNSGVGSRARGCPPASPWTSTPCGPTAWSRSTRWPGSARAERAGQALLDAGEIVRRQHPLEQLDAGLLDRTEIAAVERGLVVAAGKMRLRVGDLVETKPDQIAFRVD